MSSPEELIIAGALPGAVAGEVPEVLPVEEVPPTPLTEEQKQQLEAEVLFDWDNLPSNRVRVKRAASRDYAEALDRCAAQGYAGSPFVVSSFNGAVYEFAPNKKFATPVEAVQPSADVPPPPPAPVVVDPPAPPAPAPAPAAEVADPNEPYIKTAEGWEVRIDVGDGGGVQVFKGRTKTEVSRKLVKAQVNATKELRRRNREREVMNDLDVDTLGLERVSTPAPVTLSPDERYTLTQELQDPATSAKAFDRLLEASTSNPNSAIGARLRRAEEIVAFQNSRDLAKNWVLENPDFYNDPSGENVASIGRFFIKHSLDVTKKNLDTVFNVLRTKGALLEVPEREPEPEIPAAPAAVPASVVPAAVVPPAVPAAQVQAPPTAPAVPVRVRPGSASTGLSPRQASVRPGVNAGTTVGLTAEEYQKIPSTEARRRYNTDLAFRSGVDKLIAEGKI